MYMADEKSRFTSDPRTQDDASWSETEDWEAGKVENVDIVDGTLVSRPGTTPTEIPDSAVYDFENGNLNEWNDVHGVVSTDTSRAYSGSYSLHGNESNLNFNDFMLGWTDVEFTIGRFELYYQETSSSQGHGYELVDSNNNQILGVGSGNPNTVATDGNGGAVAPGNMDYDVWVRVTVEVDYNNNEYWVEFHNTSDGTTVSTTQDLVNNVEATRFNYVNINGRSIGDRIGSTAAHIVWTDDILLEE